MYRAPTFMEIENAGNGGTIHFEEDIPIIPSPDNITSSYIASFRLSIMPAMARGIFKCEVRVNETQFVITKLRSYSNTAFKDNTSKEIFLQLFIKHLLKDIPKRGYKVLKIASKDQMVENVMLEHNFKLKLIGVHKVMGYLGTKELI